MLASRMGSSLPLRVTVAPLSGAPRAAEPVALVYLDDPALPRNGRGERLRVLYGLSPTESRLANLLLDGISTKEAASALRLTESSARFYLKKIFRATGVNTQSGLIRLMLGLPGDIEPLAARMLENKGRRGQTQH
jgi:DNA-binding CsgD family transcriptional regulator